MDASSLHVSDLAELAFSLEQDAFAARLGGPVLVGQIPVTDDDDDGWSFNTVSMIERVVGVDNGHEFVLDRADLAFVIKKARLGAAFAQTILVGRADSNDLCIRHSSVSKLHAQFGRDPQGRWLVTDISSQNGTAINSDRIPAEQAHFVKDSDWIRFGECTFQFYSPERLHRILSRYMPQR